MRVYKYLTVIQQINTATEFIPIYHREHKAPLHRIFSRDKVKLAHSYLNEVIPDFFRYLLCKCSTSEHILLKM